jgi:serine phosphatase RsbU (regulator of sigma subunit)
MLSRVVEHARGSDIVTAVHGTIEPGSGDVKWASAGHPHGIVATAGGVVTELPGVHGPPLGVRYEHETNRHRLCLGDMLVLYTDGFIERRGEDLGLGVNRLIDVIASSHTATADALADKVVGELGNDPDDDCCLLIIHRLPG